MEFFEFIFLFSVAVVMPILIVKMGIDYQKSKRLASSGGSNGVTTGELRALLQESVEDVAAPLAQRLDRIESLLRQIESRQPGSIDAANLLSEPLPRRAIGAAPAEREPANEG